MTVHQILIGRHGQTDQSRLNLYMSSTNIPLNDFGRTQAIAFGKAHCREISQIFASPLTRAVETADLIAQSRGLVEPCVDERLVEVFMGPFEGLTRAELLTKPDLETKFRRWEAGESCHSDRGGAEDLASAQRRILASWHDIIRGEEPTILVVSHGAIVRLLACALLGMPPANYRRFRLDECCYFDFRLDQPAGGYRLHDIKSSQLRKSPPQHRGLLNTRTPDYS